jgi:hypothetical protein
MMLSAETSNSNRNRATAFRRRMADAGYVQVTGWVHRTQAADANQLLRRLKANPALQAGPLRNPETGKLVSLHGE